MKLTKYQKQGIARAIINDIPPVDYNKRREGPQEPSLLKWWSDVCAAVAIVGTCIIIVRVVA